MAAHTQSCAQGATTTTAAAKKKWVFLYLSSSSSSSFLRLFVCRWCVLREKGKVFANNSIAGRYADTIHFKICFPFIFKPQKRRKKTGAKALLLPDCLKGDLFFLAPVTLSLPCDMFHPFWIEPTKPPCCWSVDWILLLRLCINQSSVESSFFFFFSPSTG